MNRLFILILSILPCLSIYAQTMAETAQNLRQSKDLICGDGYGATKDEAKKNALNDLITKISVKLTSSSDMEQSAGFEGSEATYNSTLTNRISMYSQATLTNVNDFTISEKPEFHVFCYITREELAKIYALRQDKIDEYVNDAIKALNNRKIDRALSRMYWALALVKSLQYPEESKYKYNGQEVKLLTWLPNMIEEIIDDMAVGVTEVKNNEATLFFSYNNERIKSVEFKYWDGMQYSTPYNAKDGIAKIDLRPGTSPQDVVVRYIYNGGIQSQDEEIENMISLFGNAVFPTADVRLCTNDMAEKMPVSKETKAMMEEAVALNNETSLAIVKDFKPYDKIVQKVIKAIEAKNINSVRPLFTDEGWEMMSGLIHYGQAKLVGTQKYNINQLNDGRITCRSLTMSFTFPNNHKTFTEDVVFTFDENKLIEGVTFGLGAAANEAVFSKGDLVGWKESSMTAIVDFLENYKTAFALKRLDYIESIFDDNAYIVTGHVVKRAVGMPEGFKAKVSNEVVNYTKYTKDEYIKKLKNVFANNEFVNIQFADGDVKWMGKGGELFAIQLHQDYFSSHYGDTGYLFLIVDINNPEQPIIKVRTWQPERNPDIHANLPKNHPDYGIFTAGDF